MATDTGATTPLGGNTTDSVAGGLTTVDHEQGILYYLEAAGDRAGPSTTLKGVSLEDGAEVFSLALPQLHDELELVRVRAPLEQHAPAPEQLGEDAAGEG